MATYPTHRQLAFAQAPAAPVTQYSAGRANGLAGSPDARSVAANAGQRETSSR